MKQLRHTPRRVDANQKEIIAALEKVGFVVADTSSIGGGYPDLTIARNNMIYLVEVKVAKGRLTNRQKQFHEVWPTQIYILRTVEEVAEFSERVRGESTETRA